ncbi:MAG: 16S rRNA (cytidine(1402)-2'-O)-methyltransferase [Alphaproteobacteria bacterium]|nr:16S rRNA (cytidine(1402)-2'-O)-methyltransferase [Alphaproteobacteria bacterium]
MGAFRKSGENADLSPGLYVTSTPIGNARDITLRALDVLNGCDAIAAEDTRVTAKLLAIYGVSKPLSAYNDHNGARERPKLIARLEHGARIALVSDAGTPLVSDPGYKLVREALAEGIPVHAIPGASAVLTSLALAGLPSDRFLFAGFLPSKAGERATALSELKSIRATLIFFESAQRLAETLAQMLDVFGDRAVAVTRELTKLHEEVRRGTLSILARQYAEEAPPKGEVTLLIGPPQEVTADTALIDDLLDKALPFMPVKAASELVGQALGIPRKEIYERALMKKNGDGG